MSDTATAGPAWLDRRLFPFESRYLEADGARIHYVDEGAGEHTLLMLHGAPTWSFLYRSLITALAPTARCIALDLPGFGLSTASGSYGYTPAEHARVVERFIATLDLGNVIPVVQDWGGPIGLWAALRQQNRIRGLVIGNTFAWPVDGDPHFERFSKLMGGPIGRQAILRGNAAVNLLLPAGTRRRRLPRAVMRHYRAPFPTRESRWPTYVLPREVLGSSTWLASLERDLPALGDLPALILWPDRDIAFRASERERFESLFVNHRTVVLRGAGHFIQEDAPEEMVAEIRTWLATVGVGTASHDAQRAVESAQELP